MTTNEKAQASVSSVAILCMYRLIIVLNIFEGFAPDQLRL
jgi:hypothetical protein